MYCSSCGAQVSPASRFCSACGEGLKTGPEHDVNLGATIDSNEAGAEDETIAPAAAPPTKRRLPSQATPSRAVRTPSGGGAGLSSSDPVGGGRFTPGQILAERYRIVALAGRGGMGEVYRAEDLTLAQVVAIKFLPEALSQDENALARFHSEVRVARQVSHPNVCRVFDIGEAEGLPFLTMEFVDGEDLASVVRRIGRLSPDKATEVARQICAGLAAAHERGVVHRDLKPANVMLDGAGKIRITDFGLAGIATSIQGADVRAGTPAYMAPEQLSGKEVTARSDIYSLGLILYEILTGKRAFEAGTYPELIKLREQGTITNPSTLVRDLDPLIERVVLRCLEKDPANRPASALQVAAALPGGDPLAAALAAGETPSPEMVAAAGAKEGMRPAVAISLLVAVLAGLVLNLFLADSSRLVNLTVMDEPPQVLTARAQEILEKLGLDDPRVDSGSAFHVSGSYLRDIESHDHTTNRWKILSNDRPASITFWYRESPHDLRPMGFFSSGGAGEVTEDDPPLRITGMKFVVVDMRGRLQHLEVVPPEVEDTKETAKSADWRQLFTEAGLTMADFRPVAPEWTPLAWADARAAWTGSVPGQPQIPVRIEAAAYHGKPIYFDTIYPWTSPERSTSSTASSHQKVAVLILAVLFIGLVTAGVFVVRRNVKLNRGDPRGAVRLGSFIFLTFFAMWVLRAHHLASLDEIEVFVLALAWALLYTFLGCIFYLALEPYVRKKDPHTIISWTRLLGGKPGDPLVARDVLIGVVYGVWLCIAEGGDNLLLPLFHKLPPMPGIPAAESLDGIRQSIGLLLQYTLIFLLYGLLIFFLFFLLRLVVRKDWIAALVVIVLGGVTSTGGDYWVVTFVASLVIWLSILVILRRYGLLAVIVGLMVQNVLIVFPMTSHLSAWYGGSALVGLVAVAALAVFSFYRALAGQRIFSADLLDK
ncbi:MAG TPA: serine/threonine-protein kinase [Candidatus Acidoferrum sp.]|nr:serine/threonine-protein kinase [Candidatus Acidoferrum sp.]